MPNSNPMLDEYSAEYGQIQRRKRLAEMLQGQALEPIQQQQSGRFATPISPFQGAAKLAQAYVAALQGKKAKEEEGALGQQMQSRRSADTTALVNALGGRPANPEGLYEDASGNVTPTPATPAQSPVQGLRQAIPMMGSQMQPVALQAMMGAQQREDTQAHQAEQAKQAQLARLHERQLAIQAQAAQAGQNEQLRRDLAAQAEATRREIAQLTIASRQQPQQRQPQVIQTAEGPMVLADDGTAKPITGPGGAPVRPSQGRVGPMTATAQKELIETEEGIQGGQTALSLFQQARALNDKAMGFSGAGAVASAGSILPQFIRPGAVDATQNLDNILQTAALPQLKAIFGGMPTEGERKILLDVQGSSSKPPAVRKEIFDRAEAAIQARLKFGTEKVKRLREGTYFSGEGLPSIQMDQGTQQADRRQQPRGSGTVVVNY